MKKWLILLIVLLVFPVVSATSIPPYEVDEVGNKIDIQPLIVAKGGPPAFEHYFQGCPVVVQEEEGKPKFFYATADAEGRLQPTTFEPKKFKPIEVEEQGIACGTKFREQRPVAPGSIIPRWQQPPENIQKSVALAETYGYGVEVNDIGQYEFLNPSLEKAVDEGTVQPKLPEPKPVINIITGGVTYEANFEQKKLSAIVIPVQFSDEEASLSVEELKTNFFGEHGLGDYYDEQSYGNLHILGDIAPKWYTLKEKMGYYGNNYEENIEKMIVEAIRAADADVDFSQYDTNDDSLVDSLFVVHAGNADEETGSGNGEEIWSHYFTISPIEVDGVTIMDYETVSEMSPIGIVAHEFGHYLGLPDLYDTVVDDGSSKGVGEWSIMGYGGFLDAPASLDPWSKEYLGWISQDQYLEIENTNFYKIYQDNAQQGTTYNRITISDTEQFFIENRHRTKLMNDDEAAGLMIWHIDASVMDERGTWNGCSGTRWDCNAVNGNAEHKLIDVEEAGGKQDLDEGDMGDDGDVWTIFCSAFGGCEQSIFSKDSMPSSEPYESSDKNVVISVFSGKGTSMEFSASIDGTILEAPSLEEAQGNKNYLTIILVSIFSVVILSSGGYIGYSVLKKKKTPVSPAEYQNFKS